MQVVKVMGGLTQALDDLLLQKFQGIRTENSWKSCREQQVKTVITSFPFVRHQSDMAAKPGFVNGQRDSRPQNTSVANRSVLVKNFSRSTSKEAMFAY